ncbi:MAG: hypothetical protein M1826_002170 [Phylliscum demangeonii]|nr:MAG: hypothetical protein M1826_002170 [Phylliscum demangeonii]
MSKTSSTSSSGTKLNVRAKEFKFDPTQTFVPGSFAFGGPNGQIIRPSQNIYNVGLQSQPPRRRLDTFGGPVAGLNVGAMAFRPRDAQRSQVPSADFNFLPTGPSFNATTRTDRIFNLDKIVIPEKKSKAIPIRRPESETEPSQYADSQGNEMDQEDESGRITRTQARHKKARRAGVDGDELPKFAQPTQLAEAAAPSSTIPDAGIIRKAEGASGRELTENADLDLDPAQAAADTPSPDASMGSQMSYERTSSDGLDQISAVTDDQKQSLHVRSAAPSPFLHPRQDDAETLEEEESSWNAHRSRASVDRRPLTERGVADGTTTGKTVLPASAELPVSPSPPKDPADVDNSANEHHTLGVSTADAASPGIQSQEKQDGPRVSSVSRAAIEAPPARQTSNLHLISPNDETVLRQPSVSQSSDRIESGQWQSVDESAGASGRIRHRASSPMPNSPPLSDLAGAGSKRLLSNGGVESGLQLVNITSRGRPRDRTGTAIALALHGQTAKISLGLDEGVVGIPAASDAETPVSEWASGLSSGEEFKLQARRPFFDGHVDRLLSRTLDQRLAPLEKLLGTIRERMSDMSSESRGATKRSNPAGSKDADSDADDEDENEDGDGVHPHLDRAKSPRRDYKMGMIKAALLDALDRRNADGPVAAPVPAPASELVDIRQTLGELKELSLRQSGSQDGEMDRIRLAIQEALVENLSSRSSMPPHASATELERTISALQLTLEDAEQRAREQAGDGTSLAELHARLRAADAEAARHRALAEALERQLHDSSARDEQAQDQIQTLQQAAGDLQQALCAVGVTNALLEDHLREARASEARRGQEFDETSGENKALRKAIDALRVQLEESIRMREAFRSKFDKLQDDLTAASRRVEGEQAEWREREREHRSTQELISRRLEAETSAREQLERGIEMLEAERREAAGVRARCEQLQAANDALRHEMAGYHQQAIARQHSAVNDTREAGMLEIQTLRAFMASQVEGVTQQLHAVQSELIRAHADADHYRLQSDELMASGRRQAEEGALAKKEALATAAAAADAAMQEQHRKYERFLDDLKFQHGRALQNALDDKQRSETHLLERLGLANAKTEHVQDRVAHLEEKLGIAQEAAAAAAAAHVAQRTRASSSTAAAASASLAIDIAPDASCGPAPPPPPPAKVSAQALRESIVVLQEQLQEREMRIEGLEHDLSRVDRDAPSKLKEQQVEIGWLRELLGVRIGDLEDIIRSLASPAVHDPDALRDAAIRLKANLEMELQERERSSTGAGAGAGAAAAARSPRFPSLSGVGVSVSAFASPKTMLPLAAAWGSWRNKGREPVAADNAESSPAPAMTVNGPQTPPSKSSTSTPASTSTSSFLSGLLTPPHTHTHAHTQARRSPRLNGHGRGRPSSTSVSSSASSPAAGSGSTPRMKPLPPRSARSPPSPSTPTISISTISTNATTKSTLLNSSAYDDDATDADAVADLGLGLGRAAVVVAGADADADADADAAVDMDMDMDVDVDVDHHRSALTRNGPPVGVVMDDALFGAAIVSA